MPRKPDLEDLTGRTFGRLTAVRPTFSAKGRRQWLLSCECGGETQQNAGDLRRGRVVSCGCFKRENTSRLSTTHGHTRNRNESSEYGSWRAMKERCTNPGHVQWSDYGGRGITVCDNWAESFATFLADMGPKPGRRHQIDRIDGDGNYEPGNCRWVTSAVNNSNKRSNHRVEFRGRSLTMSEWGREIGVSASTMHIRIFKLEWPLERAMTERSSANPAIPRRGRLVEWNGESRTLTEWSKVTGLPRPVLMNRINQKGWDPERAFTTPVRIRGQARKAA